MRYEIKKLPAERHPPSLKVAPSAKIFAGVGGNSENPHARNALVMVLMWLSWVGLLDAACMSARNFIIALF